MYTSTVIKMWRFIFFCGIVGVMANILTGLCVLNSLPGPPSVVIQNATFQLIPISKRICPEFDLNRDTIFELYTSLNPDQPQILKLNDDDAFRDSSFNFEQKTIIFFHGFLESSQSDDALQIKTNYLKIGEYNIILVNNQRLLAGPYYLNSARNVEPIAKYTALFVDYLVQKGLNLSQLHIIGMSLGAQIAGLTGKNVASGKVSRITGLEPAGPYFSTLPTTQRIAPGDAEFVDIVHTNAGGFGIPYACGDLDIWVNGGTSQPACTLTETWQRNPGSVSELVFCNHYQAYRMYVMSLINSTAYVAKKCSSYEEYKSGNCDSNEETYLGVDADRSARGNYYVNTGVTAANL